jgi:glycerol-3-phosphate dehydrogenase (NAD(P)+)
MVEMPKAALIGAGSWGTALATVLAENNYKVDMWSIDKNDVYNIQNERENKRYLPGVKLKNSINIFEDIEKALKGTELVVFSVPSHALRETLKKAVPYIESDAIIVNTAKGFEEKSFLRLSQVMEEELPEQNRNKICVISGPSHAEEVGKKLPTTVVSASRQQVIAEAVQDAFMNSYFRVYTNSDIVGVELGGALKNIIALSTGISDGLGFGDNTKAAIMTRGMNEIVRLGRKLGADKLTFAGLSGVGDLIVTCTSMHSRNRRAGIALGKGKSLDKVLDEIGMVVEGVKTTKAAYKLAVEKNVEMPITAQTYKILFEGENAERGVINLMQRNRKHETENVNFD